jgi:hypothetical protein
MSQDRYRYAFDARVPAVEIEATLLIAIVATEALHGALPVRLDAGHVLDPKRRICVIDGTNEVGQDFNRLFAGLIVRQFGESAFVVQRVEEETTRRRRRRAVIRG